MLPTPFFLLVIFWSGLIYLLSLLCFTIFFKKDTAHRRLHTRNVCWGTILFMIIFETFILQLTGIWHTLYKLIFIAVLLSAVIIKDKPKKQ